jgi:chemotaxis-related protein WspD
MTRCWASIGVGGDRSCPELVTYTHCRNCPVFTAAGRELMEREAPSGYLAEWTEFLAGARLRTTTRSLSTLVFRVGAEWLAVDAATVGEVATVRPAHRIAHRTNGVLVGLVNIRGQLLLQVSLHELLHLPAPANVPAHPRLVVIQRDGASWVFAVDEVLGVQRFATTDVSPVPVTVAQGLSRVSRGLISFGEKNVGFVDSDQLFVLLRQAVG